MKSYRSARCIVKANECYLLAQHNNYLPETIGKWGLPGGRIDVGESPRETVRREMQEEFGISLAGKIFEIGDWEYRGYWHKVYATDVEIQELQFDRNEILNANWFQFHEVEKMERIGMLHTGFELVSVTHYRNQKIASKNTG